MIPFKQIEELHQQQPRTQANRKQFVKLFTKACLQILQRTDTARRTAMVNMLKGFQIGKKKGQDFLKPPYDNATRMNQMADAIYSDEDFFTRMKEWPTVKRLATIIQFIIKSVGGIAGGILLFVKNLLNMFIVLTGFVVFPILVFGIVFDIVDKNGSINKNNLNLLPNLFKGQTTSNSGTAALNAEDIPLATGGCSRGRSGTATGLGAAETFFTNFNTYTPDDKLKINKFGIFGLIYFAFIIGCIDFNPIYNIFSGLSNIPIYAYRSLVPRGKVNDMQLMQQTLKSTTSKRGTFAQTETHRQFAQTETHRQLTKEKRNP